MTDTETTVREQMGEFLDALDADEALREEALRLGAALDADEWWRLSERGPGKNPETMAAEAIYAAGIMTESGATQREIRTSTGVRSMGTRGIYKRVLSRYYAFVGPEPEEDG